MQNKTHSILANAFIAAGAWVLFGFGCWYVLQRVDPVASLSASDLGELSTNLRTLAATLAQIAVTMAGFMLAALALVLSLSERDLLRRMGVSGHLHVLILRMKASLLLCLALTALGVAYIVIPNIGPQHLYVAAAVCGTVAVSIVDVLRKLLMVFLFLSPMPKGDAADGVRTLYQDNPPA